MKKLLILLILLFLAIFIPNLVTKENTALYKPPAATVLNTTATPTPTLTPTPTPSPTPLPPRQNLLQQPNFRINGGGGDD